MLPALLATFLFCLSTVTATRATKLIGSISANFWRLILATLLLACWAHGVKSGLKGHGFPMLFWSGVIGFGLGDLALYMSLPRLGSRLTLLIVHCVAAPFAAAVEWIWLKTLLSPAQIACIGLILVGVAMALMPSQRDASWQVQGGIVGIIYGVFGALGQGMGAVMSRVAYDMNDRHGFEIDGLSAAYQRILGGLLVATLAMVFSVWKKRSLRAPKHIGEDSEAVPSTRGMSAWPFVIGTALAGPALGVGCYQWALKMTPSGVVLPIVATTPLMVMPLSAWMEGDRPPARSVYGGVLAVIGVILLGRLASS